MYVICYRERMDYQTCLPLPFRQDVNRDLKISAANGESILALTVFKHSLVYLKYQALRELNDQAEEPISREQIRWVITVPAIWSQQAKQFIREAAYSVRNWLRNFL